MYNYIIMYVCYFIISIFSIHNLCEIRNDLVLHENIDETTNDSSRASYSLVLSIDFRNVGNLEACVSRVVRKWNCNGEFIHFRIGARETDRRTEFDISLECSLMIVRCRSNLLCISLSTPSTKGSLCWILNWLCSRNKISFIFVNYPFFDINFRFCVL